MRDGSSASVKPFTVCWSLIRNSLSRAVGIKRPILSKESVEQNKRKPTSKKQDFLKKVQESQPKSLGYAEE